MGKIRKTLFFIFAVLSAAVGIGCLALSVSKPTYAIFYIFLGLILALFPFSVTKAHKILLITLVFIGLFLVIGIQLVIDDNLIAGLFCILLAAAFVYKERVEFVKQYKSSVGDKKRGLEE
jgi:membrane protease YdiL (CAAX protease family)